MKKWENNIRRVVPYVPGEQPKFSNIIKLNTNENPYPPSPKVKEALESQLVLFKQNMNQAGVKVDAVEVTVGSHELERNLEQNILFLLTLYLLFP